MPTLAEVAPMVWAKWGELFLEVLRQEALDADDGLAFRALNSEAGRRTLLVVCTTDRGRIESAEGELSLRAEVRAVDWESYSVAEMVFKTERGSGLGHRKQSDASDGTALVLCATRPTAVLTLERIFDLPE